MGTAGRVGEGGYPEAELERREGRGWDASHSREPRHIGQGIILEGLEVRKSLPIHSLDLY